MVIFLFIALIRYASLGITLLQEYAPKLSNKTNFAFERVDVFAVVCFVWSFVDLMYFAGASVSVGEGAAASSGQTSDEPPGVSNAATAVANPDTLKAMRDDIQDKFQPRRDFQ